jgi:hypothetical protein
LRRFFPVRSTPHLQQTFSAGGECMTSVPKESWGVGWGSESSEYLRLGVCDCGEAVKQVQGAPSSVVSVAPTIPPQSGHRTSSDIAGVF